MKKHISLRFICLAIHLSICDIWKCICDVLELFAVRFLFIFFGFLCNVSFGKNIVFLHSCILDADQKVKYALFEFLKATTDI